MNHSALLAQVDQARKQAWESLGQLDVDVLAPIVNPALMGGPAWPALRQAFVKIERPESILLASDGLSDPYEDGPALGLGLEFILESPDIWLRTDISHLQNSWAMQILLQVAQTAADHGGIAPLLESHGVLSMEVWDVNIPAPFLGPEGQTGVMLGLPAASLPRHLNTPAGAIRLVPITLLTAVELQYILAQGAEGRRTMAELVTQSYLGHASSLDRASLK
jgi:hypothetical protein